MKQLIIFGLTLLIMSSDYETQKYEVVLKMRKNLKKNDFVNVELDIFGKYISKLSE